VSTPLEPVAPIDTRPLFKPVSLELVALLRSLPDDDWLRPTVAGTWRVRDVVAHLVDGTLRRLAFQRDRHIPPAPAQPVTTERDFVAFINELNAQWIAVADRFSPRVLTDLYASASTQWADFVETAPLDGPALFPVSWAGGADYAGTMWFDIGREFTELWHHQMQIRDAVRAAPLRNPAYLRAVIAIAMLGLPHAFRTVTRPAGDTLTLIVTGAAGGAWTLRRDADRWSIWIGEAPAATARATIAADAAGRLLFNALPRAAALDAIEIDGDRTLAAALVNARSVIV
jgi:uncharacterized protein (TIGR03083 family)